MTDFARMEAALGKAAEAGDVAGAQQIAAEMRRALEAANPNVSAKEDPRITASRMAAEGVSGPEAALISAGRKVDRVGAGVQQVMQNPQNTLPFYGAMAGRGGIPPLSDIQQNMSLAQQQLAQEQGEKDIAFSGLRRARPFSTAIGETAPYAAIPGSMGVLPAAALVGGIEASQHGTPEDRLTRGLLGAGTATVGGYAGKALGGLIAPVKPGSVSQTQSAALRSGENLGIRPRLSQVTGNQFLARMEDMAARTPGGAGIMDDFARANSQAVNRAAARTIGDQADELGPSVFAAASDRLGKVFEAIKTLPGRPIAIGKNVAKVADDVLRQQKKMVPQQQDQNLIALANQAKTLAANKGRIDGESYQLLRSGLSDASFDATGTNRALYGKFLEAIDDAAETSLKSAGQGELAAALRTARPQYGNLKTLERGLVSEGGNVSPARLASVLRTKSPGAFREGRGGELFDIARYGESFKPLQAGSQTFERQAASDILSLATKAPWAYGWARATTSPFITKYPSLLATNPAAALTAQQVGLLATPAARGATMGLLNSYLQK